MALRDAMSIAARRDAFGWLSCRRWRGSLRSLAAAAAEGLVEIRSWSDMRDWDEYRRAGDGIGVRLPRIDDEFRLTDAGRDYLKTD